MTGAPSVGRGGSGRVRLERLRWCDLDDVLQLEVALFGDGAWTPGQFWSELAGVPTTRRYVVAKRGGHVVGYGGVLVVSDEADVQTVAVAPEAQRGGVGSAIVRDLLAHAHDRGARVVHLEVRADNAAALGLYEGLGFQRVGRRRDYYGPGRDAVLMSLRLSSSGPGREVPRG